MTTSQPPRAAERPANKQASLPAQPQSEHSPALAAPAAPTRAEINRANAQFSTGPKTLAGKAKSSRNSFKHGLYSKLLVTADENAAELDALKADLRAEHHPVNTTEEILVNEIAEQFWRLKRARLAEASLLDSDRIPIPQLTAIQRSMSSAERGLHKALTALRQLQKDRGFVPQKQDSGSVRQKEDSGFVSQLQDSGLVPQNEHSGCIPQSCPDYLDPGNRPISMIKSSR